MKLASLKRHGTIIGYNKGCRCAECVDMDLVYGIARNIDAYKELAEAGDGWRNNALCRGKDPEFFLVSEKEAIALCSGCTVQSECLAYALAHPYLTKGVWGGVSELNRDRIKRVAQRQRREFSVTEPV